MDIKQETKILNKLDKMFEQDKEQIEKDGLMTDNNVMCLIPISDDFKRIINRFGNKENSSNLNDVIDKLDFNPFEKDKQTVKTDVKLTEWALSLSKIVSDDIIITAKKDYPLKIETEHFKIIIAPMC